MTAPFAGGCACGAVRYECTAEPIVMFECHCRDCQRASGSAYAAVVYVPRKAFTLTKGSLRHHETPSEGGGFNKRGFCPECGSRISGGETDHGIGIAAGSLDDPSAFRPQHHIFVSDALHWDNLDQSLPKYPQYAQARREG